MLIAFIRTAYELRENQETTLRKGRAEHAKVPHNSVSDHGPPKTAMPDTNNYLHQLDSRTTNLV